MLWIGPDFVHRDNAQTGVILSQLGRKETVGQEQVERLIKGEVIS